MTANIFRFWSQIKPHQKIHPADQEVFKRIGTTGHGFDLRCLPGNFGGRLKDAPVVLLYLSPGFGDRHIQWARSKHGRERARLTRLGKCPFSTDGLGHKWLLSRTKLFEIDFDTMRHKLAVLNVGAYHSRSFHDHPLLAALPSSRVSIEWAQEVLFPEAMRGERVVVCMRAASFWGLSRERQYGRTLSCPP